MTRLWLRRELEAEMSGGGFILAINMSVAGLLAAAFLFIAAYDRDQRAPRWIALGYGLGILYVVLEFLVGLLPERETLVVLAAYMTFAGALAAANVGIALKYARPVPQRLTLVLLALAMLTILTHLTPQLSLVPMVVYQLPYFLLQALGAVLVMRAPSKRPLDFVLCVLLALSALQFLAKPLIGLALGNIGTTTDAYMGTTYALFSQTISSVCYLAVAVTLLIIMMRDMLGAMAVKSETDPLSGVLNRRGFEERAAPILHAYQGSRVPLSLVLCDLDHFKATNDTFGHHTGDLVIAAFARQLVLAASPGQIVGRVGGEEFAIILPGANLPVARLYAEGVRSGFSTLHIAGAPPGRAFTASFGVAELEAGEGVVELMERADAALYSAKTAGRDCVRAAPPVLEPLPRIDGRSFRAHQA